MRTVKTMKYPLLKRVKYLFTNRLYLVAVYDAQGIPGHIEVGMDKPEDAVTLTHDQIDAMVSQAQQLAIEQHTAAQTQAAQQAAVKGPEEGGTRPVNIRGPVPFQQPNRQQRRQEERDARRDK